MGGTSQPLNGAYDFTNNNVGGVYVRPTNPFTRIQPFNVVPWQGNAKPLKRIITYGPNGGGAYPAICPEAGCTYALYQDKLEYQQHLDLHHQEWVCPEERCAKSNAVFDNLHKYTRHYEELHKPESSKLPPFNAYCPECCMHFSGDWTGYNAHMRSKHPNSAAPRPIAQLRTKRD